MINTDIFATKGAEYLIVIAYLLALIAFWRVLWRPLARPAGVGLPPPRKRRSWFELRDGYYFHQGHGWAIPEEENDFRVGLDDFTQKLVGRPTAIRLPPVGARLEQGERGWSLEVEGRTIRMLAPLDGEVVEVNEQIECSPDLVCSDPFGRGWLLRVRASNGRAALSNLLTGALARSWMDDVVERLRAMPGGTLGLLMPDGGMPIDGFARALSGDRWYEVAEEFLLSH